MAKANIGEGQPRQQHSGEKEDRGDELGGTRAGGRRFERLRLGVRGIENGMRPIRGRCAARMALVHRTMRVILPDVRRPAGITGARASERDQSRDDRAEERQEDDRVIHPALSPSSG